MKYYKQCTLVKNGAQTTRWIETRGAHIGAQVEVLPEREWWTVTCVYDEVVLDETQLRQEQEKARKGFPSTSR